MIIKIDYTFTNADGKTAWDDFRCGEVKDLDEALAMFERLLPAFALSRLINIDAHYLSDDFVPQWYTIYAPETFAAFLEKYTK